MKALSIRRHLLAQGKVPAAVGRAFTLTDLLMTISLLVLVLAVAAPILSRARNAGQSEVSRANLKRLIQAHAAYSLTNQDRWMNPFNPTTMFNGQQNAADPNWHSVRVPAMPGFFWQFSENGYQTEMFATMWSRFALPYVAPGQLRSPVQFDPRDSMSQQRLAAVPDSQLSGYLADGSYWYSPTMWFDPGRYTPTPPSNARLVIAAPNQLGGTHSVRYNTTAQVTYPSQKAVLFTRFDFDQTSRTAPNAPFPPQWNNSAAVSDTAFADGSVDEVSIAKQLKAMQNPSVASWLTPTNPNWNLPTALLANYDMHLDHLENGQNGTSFYRAWFWGTRNGVQGRDVIPR